MVRPTTPLRSSNKVASSAQDASFVSSASVHEQAGSSDVPPPKKIQSSSLQAIIHATRVMTLDYGSVLVDHGKYVSPQVAELVYMLVKLDKEQSAAPPGEKWEDRYARELLAHFR